MEEEHSEDDLDKIRDTVSTWGVAFSESTYFEDLTEEQKRESEFIILSFTDYMYTHHGLSPEEWDDEDSELEECCLYTLPQTITADKSYFRSIAPVLSAFFSFVKEQGLLRNAATLATRVKALDREIVKNACDPHNWGHAKSFMMAAKDAGVDTTSIEALNKFLQFYNLQQLAKTKIAGNSRAKPKTRIGRNDPCPCGSGKKYKKCCGR
jgi:hypothetical protein